MNTPNLSIVISAYNEEKKIEDCLRSASFADEIIFVDNSSNDQTVQIAKKYTSKIFIRPNSPMLNVNKNFGFSKASGEWIFSLDADERITPSLQREIKSTIKKLDSRTVAGYWIPRKNIIFGKWIKHTGWYPDYQLRLIRRGRGKFPERHVHEMVKISGETEKLTQHLLHYNYETIFQFLQKLTVYIPSEGDAILRHGYRVRVEDAVKFPAKEFISRFFAREGYKDGLHGLTLSLLMGFYHLLVFIYIWEKQGFKQPKDDTLFKSELEFKNIAKEFNYWNKKAKIDSTSSLLKKIWVKIWG